MSKKNKRNKKKKGHTAAVLGLLCAVVLVCAMSYFDLPLQAASQTAKTLEEVLDVDLDFGSRFGDWLHMLGTDDEGKQDGAELSQIPEYSGKPYVNVNGGEPFFSEDSLTQAQCEPGYESYSSLDLLGRCSQTMACVGRETMPTAKRESIGMVKPTGWQTVRYDDLIEDKYLYNRCHLIGYQLTGENANERNLITGTRYMNVEGMLPFENKVADYVEDTGNHVLYRVSPMFDGMELVARGVLMEAQSLEDGGEDLEFCVFVYNVQPGIEIDYLTGESQRSS